MIGLLKKADVSFTYLKDIGQAGQNSCVYLARDEHLNAEVAIKEVLKSKIKISDYFQEAQVLYASRHPNIVAINYACQDQDKIYVCMPFYTNGTINDKLDKTNITPRELIRYSINFLSGLHHIHSKSLMHFDIKPNNIMLSDRDEAMLSDFGLAQHIDPKGFASQGKHYGIHMPPEAFSTKQFNLTYDIYQAGITMYRMAVGSMQFSKEVAELLSDPSQSVAKIKSGNFPKKNYQHHIPKPLRTIINKCLSVSPSDRYQSALDVLNALSAIDNVCLDWKFEDTTTHYIWSKMLDEAKMVFTVDKRSTACEMFKEKTDGTRRKDNSNCKKQTNNSDIYMILKGN